MPRKSTNRAGNEYRKTTLRNGVRVVTETLPSVRSIAIGVWVNVGSRHESPADAGISHFIEHLVFKGTKSRNARQIAGSLESLGGSLNAFTTKEQTCFTARVLDEHLPQAIDVLADLTCHATFSPTNINRERLVICEEIKESLDTPTDHIHDMLGAAFWGKHPLGRPIMGSQKTIMAMKRAQITRYLAEHYRSGSIVVAASGSVSHERLLKLVRQKFSFPDGVAPEASPASRVGSKRLSLKQDDNSQTQFAVAFPGLAHGDSRRMAMMLMTSHLGGGMSSVLFQKIREQKGLAYSVYCYHDFLSDNGLFCTYLGTDKTHLKQAFDVIVAECNLIKRRKLTSVQLDKVKALLKGHLTIGMESTSNRMVRLGRQEILGKGYLSLSQIIEMIDAVTASEVLEVANLTFDDNQRTIAALGPVNKGTFELSN